jgi:uncharacterized membrane protein YkgB
MSLMILSFMVTTPGVWEPTVGGHPALSALLEQFLVKEVALLGILLWSCVVVWQASEQRREDSWECHYSACRTTDRPLDAP